MVGFLQALRAANVARQAEWDEAGGIDLAFRCVELGGEVGEALNVVKKLARERMGVRGSRATVDQLAEELADVVICADLVGIAAGLDWRGLGSFGEGPLRFRTPDASAIKIAHALLVSSGMVVRAARAHGEGFTFLGVVLDGLLQDCGLLAVAEGIDLNRAVVAKFNATSERVGLATRLEWTP